MLWIVAALALLVGASWGLKAYTEFVTNPRVIAELEARRDSERASRVTVMYFDDGATIPVNYLKDGSTVYVGADGRWWRRFRAPGSRVTLLIEGQLSKGHGVAILDDPERTREVFDRLRPAVPRWLPRALDAVLVEISLGEEGALRERPPGRDLRVAGIATGRPLPQRVSVAIPAIRN
jgi:hypothetical protein